jgi:hypothetical protein
MRGHDHAGRLHRMSEDAGPAVIPGGRLQGIRERKD